MMRNVFTVLAVSTVVLAGCEISDDTETTSTRGVTVAATEVTLGSAQRTVDVVYDEDTDTITIINGTTNPTWVREDRFDTEGFRGYTRRFGGLPYALFGVTPSGQGRVIVALDKDQAPEILKDTIILERTAETVVPDTGTGRYTGPYSAIVDLQNDWTNTDSITGTAYLDVDFDGSRVSGGIIDRRNGNSPTVIDDVIFNTADLIDGAFSGTTIGGDTDSWGPALGGEYTGMLTGPNGEEAIGGVIIQHDTETPGAFDTWLEVGAFIVD